ncbi:hypothetical protein HGRIS_011708 [Hohenbuehelia grisea]|uniref:S5 DRBM domain-containing protein n=1 Tax=Hohenbuehelia grisea TaxID=104357 RepID=A0ABR3JXC0_9AGAR
MHRLARQARISSLPGRWRVHQTRSACLQSLRFGKALHRYYSTPTSSTPEFDALLASIKQGAPDDELAKSVSLLFAKTFDPEHLGKLNNLLFLYAEGLDSAVLSERVSQFMSLSPDALYDESIVPTPETDTAVLEDDSEGLGVGEDEVLEKDEAWDEDVVESTESAEEAGTEGLLNSAEMALLNRRLTEVVVARAMVHLIKTTTDTTTQQRLAALPQIIAEASRKAAVMSEGGQVLPVFGPGDSLTGPTLIPLEPEVPRMIHDHDNVGSKLDQLLASPEDTDTLQSVVPHFVDDQGNTTAQLAPLLQQLGFQTSVQSGQDSVSTFQSSLNEATRESEDSNDIDLSALTGKQVEGGTPFPDLMTPDPLMDSRDVVEFPPDKGSPYHNRVVVRNHASIFHEQMISDGQDLSGDDWKPEETDETEEEQSSSANLPLGPKALSELYRFPIFNRRITQQTGKGKIHRIYSMVIVGNGDGLVGYGEGKDEDSSRAEAKAFAEAVQNMDWVERFEKRTVWTEMETKLGSTRVILRPRPVGFGLRCNPNLHQVLKAAGIKDISAKVWGSRNPINVIKAAFRMLQSGNAPLSMGDGVGGGGRKLNKGSGARGMEEVERERGRKLIGLRK